MMNEGTIISYKNIAGQIKGDDGKTYDFNRKAVVEGNDAQAVPGRRVRFQADGERARDVRMLDAMAALTPPKAKPVAPPPPSTGPYRFLNPYNFVRPLEQPRPAGHVLGDCPPPPHDRYVGLSGVIVCRLTNVTPLFISDAHNVEPDPQHPDHKCYHFFRVLNDEGELEPALPASSLRGMVRSVFETVTNSCLGVFQKDEEVGKIDRLEYRVSRDPGLMPGRVLDVAASGARVELLDCATMSPPVDCRGQPTTVKSGVVSAYIPRVLRKIGEEWVTFDRRGVITATAQDGDRVAALVSISRVPHRSNRFQYFRVIQVVPAAQHASLTANSEQRKVFGYLHVTGPNIENKHDERLFFRWDDQDPLPQATYTPTSVTVNADVVDEYNRSLKKYWERHAKRVEELQKAGWHADANTLPFPSSFVRDGRALRSGDLVYHFTDQQGNAHLVPVSMPRVPYRYPREKLLTKHLLRCQDARALCPACRTFGWVYEGDPKHDAEIMTAYAGRVRLTTGMLKLSQGTLDSAEEAGVPLAILSGPKPTTTAFYLLPANGRPGEADYNQVNARLRGRKFYRHHGVWSELSNSQQREHRRASDKRDQQNRTVKGVLNPNAEFEFRVYFENLQPVELGALLWTLQLEDGMYHRLGFAKPLGFGSVTVTVQSLHIISIDHRYNLLNDTAQEGDSPEAAVATWIGEFKKAMQQVYSKSGMRFDTLPSAVDLRAVLSKPAVSGELHIHYPRHARLASADGENFKWFVGNRKRLEDSRRPLDRRNLPVDAEPQWLPIAADDRSGLELMDERGNPVRG
jgi:CRISPR-associated protein (TIGR03986 family)